MNFTKQSFLFVLVAASVLFLGTSAHADDLQLIYSGANISGNLTLTATPNGDGTETVTSIAGSQILNGQAQTVSGILLPTIPPAGTLNGRPYSNYDVAGIGTVFSYDDLIALGSSPVLDALGLVFHVSGELKDVNLCANVPTSAEICGLGGTLYSESTYVGSGGNDPNPAYQDYGISSLSLVRTPEPSTLLLLGCGLTVMFFLAGARTLTKFNV